MALAIQHQRQAHGDARTGMHVCGDLRLHFLAPAPECLMRARAVVDAAEQRDVLFIDAGLVRTVSM